MEHSLSRPQVARPWRTATIVASAVAALELAFLVALGLPMLGRAVAEDVRSAAETHVLAPAPKPAPASAKAEEAPAAPLPRADTSVVVLNGNGRTGAAGAAADRVHELGYLVAGTGNAGRSDYARTIVMFRPGRKAEAQRLAKDVGAKVVGPLDGLRLRDLMGAQVAIILGSD
jgi:hypothetical protein